MNVCIDFDLDIRCVGCGRESTFPDAEAQRVLHVDGVIYADVDRRCRCGSKRVRISVKFDGREKADSDEASEEGLRPPR